MTKVQAALATFIALGAGSGLIGLILAGIVSTESQEAANVIGFTSLGLLTPGVIFGVLYLVFATYDYFRDL